VVVDLVIQNARIVSPRGVFEAGIAVDEGKIVTISKTVNLPKADSAINAKGNLVLPGVIDAHVHFREPGNEKSEDFGTGTKAAAAGGVTTVFDMPNSIPAVSSAGLLTKKREIVKKRAFVDFALYGGAGTSNIDEITGLTKAGAIGFKTFLLEPPAGKEIECGGTHITSDGALLAMLETVRRTNLPVSIHAENPAIINFYREKLMKARRQDPMAHAESRPNFVEAEAIAKVIILAKTVGTRIHIAHLSTKEGLQLITQAKASDQQITTETCPHYLMLTAEDMKRLGPYGKINPPLRSKADVVELFRGLNDGSIDMLVSDHAPHIKEDKEVGWENIWKAKSGAPNIQTMLPLMLTKVNEGNLSIERLVKITSENVAKIFGIYPKKGVIQKGSDADLVIIDLNQKRVIEQTQLYSKAKDLDIYLGSQVKGYPIITLVRGEIVMDDGIIIGKSGHGEFISPIEKGGY
jgi:allantoinase